MKIEVLIATMHNNNILELMDFMNIQSDCIVVNQCDVEKEDIELLNYKGYTIKVINSPERGLSRSRNKALENVSKDTDIVILSDDDIRLSDLYKEKVVDAYKNTKASGIAFKVKKGDGLYNKKLSKKLNQITLFRASSVSLTFRYKDISNLKFDVDFGAGSGKYVLGEENIFVSDLLKKGKIIESNEFVLCEIIDKRESTWNKGMNKDFLFSKGASFKRMHKYSYWFFVFDFAFRKRKLYKNNMNFLEGLKCIYKGAKNYGK